MSLHGSLHAFLNVEDIEEYGIEEMQAIMGTGDLPPHHSSMGMPMHLFSWEELRALLERHPCDVVVATAANFLSIGNDEVCERWLQDQAMWERFLAWEVHCCAQPGAIDGGTHIIAVVRAH